MVGLFKVLGIAMAIYGCYGIYAGQIYSTRDGQTFYKSEHPFYFWAISVGYLVVGALIFIAIHHKYG